MTPLGPRSRHLLDQVMAFNLEVQGKLRRFEEDLQAIGYDRTEAWAIARALEARLLGPVVDDAARALPAAEDIDAAIRNRLEELNG